MIRRILKTSLHSLLVCALCLVTLMSGCQDIYAQDYIYLSFPESFMDKSGNSVKLPALKKSDRANSRASIIRANSVTTDEQIDKCLNYAISVWQSRILDCDSIFIDIAVAEIDCDLITEVKYVRDNNVYVPSALNAYKNKIHERDHQYPDGKITINSRTSWDYSLGEDIPNNCKSLTFALLRGIGEILGFGSSVKINDNGQYYFGCKRGYSVFDNLVINSERTKLTTVTLKGGRPNTALNDFIQSGTKHFWIEESPIKLELAPPPYTNSNLPFANLNDKTSLMGPIFDVGSYSLQIDDKTMTVMKILGWNESPTTPIKIVCDELDDSGLASAYTSHIFRIEHDGVSLQNPSWSLELPLGNGKSNILTLSDNNLSCKVPEIKDENIYKINQDGDIEGILRFTCKINGKTVTALPYRIYFELKPYIEEAVIERIVDNYPLSSYDAYYKVKYRGASSMTVSVEEEYGSKLKSSRVKEPYIGTGVIKAITAPYYAWMDFVVENKYGKITYTIELAPNGIVNPASLQSSSNYNHKSSVNLKEIENNLFDCYEVYDFKGLKIKTCSSKDELKNLKGFFVVKCYSQGIYLKTIKLSRL